jgi:hypothetical protein
MKFKSGFSRHRTGMLQAEPPPRSRMHSFCTAAALLSALADWFDIHMVHACQAAELQLAAPPPLRVASGVSHQNEEAASVTVHTRLCQLCTQPDICRSWPLIFGITAMPHIRLIVMNTSRF